MAFDCAAVRCSPSRWRAQYPAKHLLLAPALVLKDAPAATARACRSARRCCPKSRMVLNTYAAPAGPSSAPYGRAAVRPERNCHPSRGSRLMPEVIFTGPAGRIEGRYHPARQKNAPIAIVLHPASAVRRHDEPPDRLPALLRLRAPRTFPCCASTSAASGAARARFDHGPGELSDAASALDWAQSINPEARSCWIAGFSFGAWIGMQLLMRRPEIEGFISIAPPANLYDFSFLAPCPSSGLIVHGDKDAVVPHKDVTGLVDKLKTQKGIVIEQKVDPGRQPLLRRQDRAADADGRRPISTSGSRSSASRARPRALPRRLTIRTVRREANRAGAPHRSAAGARRSSSGKVSGRPLSARTAR